ncbi:GntR family transcriptional regulator [uncultured Sphaerochaeta sp.]|uniref:GntR family transcriptional regulator n=1 Tax=uncultured Sphaerochaeta sp. TaxID=886478 RepID=UPI002A0A9926|nr:GntR family transcriptional regulator [uncultured Sphaerochaeta sp.]
MDNNSVNLKNDAYEYLRALLLDCEIKPGEDINEKQIVEKSGFSRTPIREALILLQSENLVEVIPRKGTYAKRIDINGVMELFELRKLIEPALAVKFRSNMDFTQMIKLDTELKYICDNPDTTTIQDFYRTDIAFHSFVINSSKNERIIKMFLPVMQEAYRIGINNTFTNTEHSRNETYVDHHRIIRSILSESDADICKAYLYHLNNSMISALDTIKLTATRQD